MTDAAEVRQRQLVRGLDGGPCPETPASTALARSSDTLRDVLATAVCCYTLAAVAELTGIWLAAREIRATRAVLRGWRRPTRDGVEAMFRRRDPSLAHYQLEADEDVLEHLLGKSAGGVAAVALLVLGVLAGTAGNFLSLMA